MRWVVFGTYDAARHPRVGVLIAGLAAAGDTVVECNEPLRLDTAARVAILRQPWRLPVGVGRLVRCWLSLLRKARAVRRLPPDAVLVGYLGHFDVRLARWLFRRTPIVLDHLVSAAGTARDRQLAGSGGLKNRLLRAIDTGALRAADLVVVDTAEHAAAAAMSVKARRVVIAPVGAGTEWFAQGMQRRAEDVVERALRVVFVGVFTPLHGTPAIAAALAQLAGDEIEVTMVGTGQDYAECRRIAAGNARVRWVDWVASPALPAFVAGHDVTLGIFGTTAKAANVVPTKVYQGAAAGCAVVTSDTSPQRGALGPAAVYVPAGDPDALAQALRRLAKDRAEVTRLGAAAHELALARYTPAAVVAPIRAAMSGVAG